MTLPSVKKAFLIHFGISLLIFIVLAALMRIIWYPGDLFFMDGGWQGLQLIAPIDLILGPALTLCFYRPWKKNIKFDMAAIATVQIAALGYGVFVAYQQRPAAIVFAENRFETLSLSEYKTSANDLLEAGIQPKSLSEFSAKMPVLVKARSFVGDDYGQYLADVLNGLPELRERSDRYQPIIDARQQIAEHRLGSQDDGTTIAAANNGGQNVEIPASSKPETLGEDATLAVPAEIYTLKARYLDGTIEFNPESFEWTKITRDSKSATK